MARRTMFLIALFIVGAMAVPVAQAGGGGGCHEATTTHGNTTTVDMKDSCFSPTVTTIEVGDAVKWSNYDSYEHVVTGAGGSWGTKAAIHQDAVAVRFDSPGVYPYWCEFHPGMVGAVVVGDGKATGGTATAGSGPVAVTVSDESDPSGGSGTAPVTDEAPRTTPAQSDGMSATAVVAIATIAGLLGYGAAHLLGRRHIALLATKKLG